MNQPLSIFNSKLKPLLVVTLFAFVLFVGDRVMFRLSFWMYEQHYNVAAVGEDNDVFMLGTSHLDRDVDLTLLRRELKSSVGLFAVHGSSLIPRYYALKERLSRTTLPKVVVIELSPWMLNRVRYKDDVTAVVLPFYHRGLMEEFVEKYAVRDKDWYAKNIFKVYSLNFGFTYFFLDPVRIGKYFASNFLSETNSDRLQTLVGKKTADAPTLVDAQQDSRIAGWRTLWDARGKNYVEPELKEKFQEMMDWLAQRNVPTVLLQLPFYHFDGEEQFHPELLSILKQYDGQKNVSRWFIDMGNNSALFEDSSHLDQKYARHHYTLVLAKKIAKNFAGNLADATSATPKARAP